MKTPSIIRRILTLLAVILTAASSISARTDMIGWDGSHYHSFSTTGTIGLALSGGGARGFSQIGILKAFEKSGLQISAIAGTSIGGIIGGLYASGYSADELDSIVSRINFNELFSNRPERKSMFLTQRPEKERYIISVGFDGIKPTIPQALTAGQKLSDLLLGLTLKPNYISGGQFGRLPIPFCPVTTDIISGREIILQEGNLADAMRATMAFPLAFTGVEYGDMLLMDGGMLNPVPVSAVRRIEPNVDIIVAVNTTSELLPGNRINNPIDVANQVTTIMTMDKKDAALEETDVAISPPIKNYQSTDFEKFRELVQIGYEAGLAAAEEIKAKLDQAASQDSLLVTSIHLAGPATFNVNAIESLLNVKISRAQLQRALHAVHAANRLFLLNVEYIEDGGETAGARVISLVISGVVCPEMSALKINLSGNAALADSVILGIVRNTGEYLCSENMRLIRDSIIARYNALGLDMVRFRTIDYVAATNSLVIDIDEGTVERIEIYGNRRTKEWLIMSNFPLAVGRPLNLGDVRRGVGNLYSTDLFRRVTLNVLPGDSGAVVHINVEERNDTQMRFGWNWDDEYHSQEFGEILKSNLMGAGQEFLLHAQYAPRRQIYSLHLKADRFFSTYLTYKAEMYYKYLERQIYGGEGERIFRNEEDRYGLQFILGQQIARFGTVTGEIKWDEIDNRNSVTGDVDDVRLRTITLRSLVETINRYPFPTEGKKHLFYVEFAADILGGEASYTKFFSSIESYFPITSTFNFHPKVAIGWTAKESGIPVPEKFYMGGQYSFAGYHTDELVGDNVFLGNLEFRFKLPYRFYLTGRYDIGQMYNERKDIKLQNLRHGYGVAVSYDSMIGPIDFGYGRAEHGDDKWYFSAGLSF